MAPIPPLQTDCAPQKVKELGGDHPAASRSRSTLPGLKLSQTWMPSLQASVWYVWYIRLLLNPTIYQTYSYSVLLCLRGFLKQWVRQQGRECVKITGRLRLEDGALITFCYISLLVSSETCISIARLFFIIETNRNDGCFLRAWDVMGSLVLCGDASSRDPLIGKMEGSTPCLWHEIKVRIVTSKHI